MGYKTYTPAEISTLLTLNDRETIITISKEIHPADISSVVYLLPSNKKRKFLDIIKDEMPHEALLWFDDNVKLLVIDVLGYEKVAELLNQVDIEDLISFIDELDPQTRDSIVQHFSDAMQQLILSRLQYDENSIGRIMEKYSIIFPEHWTIKQALNYFRNYKDKRHLFSAVVVNKNHEPLGCILISDLLRHQPNQHIVAALGKTNLALGVNDNTSKAVNYFKQYDVPVIPVVNLQQKFIGTVSMHQMAHLITEEIEDEMLQLGGVAVNQTLSRLFAVVQLRFPWLFINLVMACIISNIIGEYADVISSIPAAAIMLPIAASMGGNAASQTMTITVRELSKNHISKYNCWGTVFKEILATATNGFILALISIATSLSIVESPTFAVIFGSAVMINFIVAGLVGSAIPIILYLNDIDPAAASSVLVTACTDSMGFFCLLGLIQMFLL